jgi:hypothetical protein
MYNYILFLYSTEFTEYELAKKHNLDFLKDCEALFYRDPKLYTNDTRKKIAVVPLSEEIYNDDYKFSLVYDLSSVDLIVVHSREDVFKNRTAIEKEIGQMYNNNNICVLAGGIDYRTASPDYFYPMLTHFRLTVESSTNLDFTYSNTRMFLFDSLLGTPKPSRKYIYYRLLEDNLLDKSLLSITVEQDYYQTDHYDDLWPNISLIYEEKFGKINGYRSKFLETVDTQAHFNNFEKIDVSIEENNLVSAINGIIDNTSAGHPYWRRMYNTPYEVYKNSWYSIISETYQNFRYHPTEKTGKALLGGRIFVVFCCQHFLKNLKKLGFKTFNSIIDESYDDIEDTAERFNQAWEQIRVLSKADHHKMYSIVEDIVEHNRNIMLDKNFQLKEIEKFIYDRANN